MIKKRAAVVMFLLCGAIALAQAPPDDFHPAASTKQLMLDFIHPASNDILLAVFRSAPQNESNGLRFGAVRWRWLNPPTC